MKRGQPAFKTGDAFDFNKVKPYHVFDIKTTLMEKPDPEFRRRMNNLIGADHPIVLIRSRMRWTAGKGWHFNARYHNWAKFWRNVGGAAKAAGVASILVMMNFDLLEDQIQEIIAKANYIKTYPWHDRQGGAELKVLAVQELNQLFMAYLENLTDEGPAGVLKLLRYYRSIEEVRKF